MARARQTDEAVDAPGRGRQKLARRVDVYAARVEKELAGRKLVLEVGEVAKQANGATLVSYGETVVLVTAVVAPEVRGGIDFVPLTVDYREKAYAAGKIPGGFFKREGRPSEREVLTSRLIDRPIRPLFPKALVRKSRSSPSCFPRTRRTIRMSWR